MILTKRMKLSWGEYFNKNMDEWVDKHLDDEIGREIVKTLKKTDNKLLVSDYSELKKQKNEAGCENSYAKSVIITEANDIPSRIYIKDFIMPKNCSKCELTNCVGLCLVNGSRADYDLETRPDNCPLVEVFLKEERKEDKWQMTLSV